MMATRAIERLLEADTDSGGRGLAGIGRERATHPESRWKGPIEKRRVWASASRCARDHAGWKTPDRHMSDGSSTMFRVLSPGPSYSAEVDGNALWIYGSELGGKEHRAKYAVTGNW